MKNRNTLPLALMISSLVLLFLLQGFWLATSYEKAYRDLHQRSSDLFRSTLLQMRDSIFMTNSLELPLDAQVTTTGPSIFFDRRDTLVRMRDTVKLTRKRTSSTIEVFVASKVKADSLKMIFGDSHQGRGRFLIRFAPDSIATDTIANHYKKALSRLDIDLAFDVKKIRKAEPIPDDDILLGSSKARKPGWVTARDQGELSVSSKELSTEWVRFDPITRYATVFPNVRPFLFWQISPQILLSVVLTIITAGAFWLMYRNIKAQQRLMEMKNDFISNITHELKTPVTTVSVALEALKNFKGLDNPKITHEYLDIAQSELNRLTLLTDKILKTVVFENKGINFEPEPVDLHKTIEQILHSMKLLFEKQKAQVKFERQGDSFVIHGGSVHLTNVVYNLLDNALKYSVNEPQINVRLEESDNRVVLKISDNGIGIPAEYKNKIFEKFFRVPTGDVHNIKGYGLGLSYVESVIRSHRGLIDVVSTPGQGSMFTITLPKQLS